MTCRRIDDGGREWIVCPVDPAPEAYLLRAVVRARLIDELTRQPPGAPPRLSTSSRLLTRAGDGGRVGLIGVPGRIYHQLDVTPVDLDLTVSTPGYLPRREQWTLGPIAGFPAAFAAIDAGEIALHRPGTALRGRVTQRVAGVVQPAPASDVELLGYWVAEPALPIPAPDPSNVVELRPGFYARRAVTAVVRRRVIIVAAGNHKQLLLPAAPGDQTVRLSDRVGLAVGNLLAIDSADPERSEYLAVTAIDGASTPDQACTVTLAHPLAVEHRVGVDAARAVAGAQGPVNRLIRDALEGDRPAYLDGLAGLDTAQFVQVSGGALPEFHRVRRYQVASDGDGYYLLPPIARASRLRIRARRGAAVTIRDVSPDYGRPENRVDLEVA